MDEDSQYELVHVGGNWRCGVQFTCGVTALTRQPLYRLEAFNRG
jgi:hypothetical protein